MKDFDVERQKRLEADRTFKIGGQEFSYRASVAPEAILEWSEYATAGERELGALVAARTKLRFALARIERADPDSPLLSQFEETATRLTEEVEKAAAAYEETRRTDTQWVAVLDSTIVAMLEDGQAERWEAVRSPSVELPISMQDLQDLIEFLMEQVSNRPTGPSSDSSSTADIATDVPASPAGTALTGDSSFTAEPESAVST